MVVQCATSRDRSPIMSVQKHPSTGVITLSGRLTRPGLLPYAPSELPYRGKYAIVYRSEAAVFDPAYLGTVKGSVVSRDHSFLETAKGATGLITKAEQEGGYVAIELMITDEAQYEAIFEGAREISAGYAYDYALMSVLAIDQAKAQYPVDYANISRTFPAGTIPVWVSARNLRNNHVTPVLAGRAGSACAIDNQYGECMEMNEGGSGDSPSAIDIPVEGAIEVAESGLDEATISKMVGDLFALASRLQSHIEKAGLSFDSNAFAADRSGYVSTVLSGLGVTATDASFSEALDLVEAYSIGYSNALNTIATPETVEAAEVKATDNSTHPVTIARKTGDFGEDFGSYRSPWDKLTKRVSSAKTKGV